MGAQAYAYDVRAVVQEQVESLGGIFLRYIHTYIHTCMHTYIHSQEKTDIFKLPLSIVFIHAVIPSPYIHTYTHIYDGI